MKILAISSSFSKFSKSNRIVKILKSIELPNDVSVEAANIKLNLFSADKSSFDSQAVVKFRQQLEDSKAVLFVASEMPNGFQYSVTAALLNSINWGSHEKNLFYNKSAAFASVDNFNTLGPGTNWDTALHKNNLYHLRELCGVVGMNCLKSKFDLHPGKHYSLDSEELDEEQELQVTNTLLNLVHDLAYFHRFEKKKRKHRIPTPFHLVSPETFL